MAALLLLPATALNAQETPAGVTPEAVAAGAELYKSQGCAVCHGDDGKGKPGMTSDLTDAEWGFAAGGSFDALVAVVRDGLTPAQTGGMPMPAGTTKNFTDEQVKSLAAYIWQLGGGG